MDNQGVLAVVSGFSGAGKGTLIRTLLAGYQNYALSVSATTRSPRPGEADGREYFFRTNEEFERMIEKGELLEYARYVDHYYGTPKEYVLRNLEAGRDVLLEIEIQGALAIRERFPEAVLLFVTAPDAAQLKKRLTGRGTEDMAVIEKRLRRAAEEADGIEQYDYILVNDEVESCAMRMHGLIQAAHARVGNHLEFIRNMRDDLKAQTQA
ncbi:guanylate kinase [Clostridiaceae bacterium]|jgi:guanylate kinase|nr:guanylate kinase [Clostridiaceae bacterium]